MLARGYDLAAFETEYGALEQRPAYVAGVWWTGDEDLDWTAEFSDTGRDGVYADDRTFGSGTPDTGENDGMPTDGEPNFNQTDITESDQIGLTGFKLNRIRGAGETDGIVFFTNEQNWPERLYDQFSNPNPSVAFDPTIVNNYNIGFLFASGPFTPRRRPARAVQPGAGLRLEPHGPPGQRRGGAVDLRRQLPVRDAAAAPDRPGVRRPTARSR